MANRILDWNQYIEQIRISRVSEASEGTINNDWDNKGAYCGLTGHGTPTDEGGGYESWEYIEGHKKQTQWTRWRATANYETCDGGFCAGYCEDPPGIECEPCIDWNTTYEAYQTPCMNAPTESLPNRSKCFTGFSFGYYEQPHCITFDPLLVKMAHEFVGSPPVFFGTFLYSVDSTRKCSCYEDGDGPYYPNGGGAFTGADPKKAGQSGCFEMQGCENCWRDSVSMTKMLGIPNYKDHLPEGYEFIRRCGITVPNRTYQCLRRDTQTQSTTMIGIRA